MSNSAALSKLRRFQLWLSYFGVCTQWLGSMVKQDGGAPIWRGWSTGIKDTRAAQEYRNQARRTLLNSSLARSTSLYTECIINLRLRLHSNLAHPVLMLPCPASMLPCPALGFPSQASPFPTWASPTLARYLAAAYSGIAAAPPFP